PPTWCDPPEPPCPPTPGGPERSDRPHPSATSVVARAASAKARPARADSQRTKNKAEEEAMVHPRFTDGGERPGSDGSSSEKKRGSYWSGPGAERDGARRTSRLPRVFLEQKNRMAAPARPVSWPAARPFDREPSRGFVPRLTVPNRRGSGALAARG